MSRSDSALIPTYGFSCLATIVEQGSQRIHRSNVAHFCREPKQALSFAKMTTIPRTVAALPQTFWQWNGFPACIN